MERNIRNEIKEVVEVSFFIKVLERISRVMLSRSVLVVLILLIMLIWFVILILELVFIVIGNNNWVLLINERSKFERIRYDFKILEFFMILFF